MLLQPVDIKPPREHECRLPYKKRQRFCLEAKKQSYMMLSGYRTSYIPRHTPIPVLSPLYTLLTKIKIINALRRSELSCTHTHTQQSEEGTCMLSTEAQLKDLQAAEVVVCVGAALRESLMSALKLNHSLQANTPPE